MKKLNILIFSFFNLLILGSCSDMLSTDSELVENESENTLNHPTDSVYSVLGIINKLQVIADRTVILGEVRGDLMTVTDAASTDLKQLAAFNFSTSNKYNQVSDYYAVINNCNYFLAHVDTTMHRRGRNLFLPEYAVVKSYRAWTYLQLALIYGEVPLILNPVMTEREAAEAMNNKRVGIREICDYFIKDLTPYVGYDLPKFGTIDGWDSEQFFIPMRALLGDLCLWSGHYEEAAYWYHQYLTDDRAPILMSNSRSYWPNPSNFTTPRTGYSVTSTIEVLSFIPMEARVFDGIVSDLPNIMESTTENKRYYSLTPSTAMSKLSAAQVNCVVNKTDTQSDTVYVPQTGLSEKLMSGDLRYYSNFRKNSLGIQNEYSEYSTDYQSMYKIWSSLVPTYRRTMLYLRYAEALNRARLPQSAMMVLKYGVSNDTVHIDSLERAKAGQLIYFDPNVYKLKDNEGKYNYVGVHSLGSGDSYANAYYTLPQPRTKLATRDDTIDFQIPRVEKMIIDEMALEGAFEGYRYYDLMRVALRNGDNSILADSISKRSGTVNTTLRSKLMDQKNWYLPLP